MKSYTALIQKFAFTFCLVALWSVCCGQAIAQETPCETGDGPCITGDQPCETGEGPCVTGEAGEEEGNDGPCVDGDQQPNVVEGGSPFEPGSMPKGERRLWAKSYLWAKAPEFVVEKWLSEKPEMKGKYVLIEYWATWCPPCRRSLNLLNEFHRKYKDELVVIGISEETEEAVRKLKEPKIEFYSAIDTKMRMKNELGVFGIPHVIILEPGGYVIWEGFPLQPHYELTHDIINRILEIGRKLKAQEAEDAASAE